MKNFLIISILFFFASCSKQESPTPLAILSFEKKITKTGFETKAKYVKYDAMLKVFTFGENGKIDAAYKASENGTTLLTKIIETAKAKNEPDTKIDVSLENDVIIYANRIN